MEDGQVQVNNANHREPAAEPDYWFRLRIELSPLQIFNSDETKLTLNLIGEGKGVILRPAPPGKLSQAKTIDFDAHGFDSRDHAHRVGLRLRKAVSLSAAIETIGVDVGIDQVSEDNGDGGERAKGYRVKDRMQGLTVHEGPLVGGMISNARIVHAPSPDSFIKGVEACFALNPSLSERQTLALELFGLSQFETSARARFLVLTSCMEVLADHSNRPRESLDVIDQLLANVDSSSLDVGQKQSLRAGIESLRTESIGKSCRKLVQRYLGKEAADKFNEIYTLRSKLLRAGDCTDGNVGDAEFHLTHMAAAIFRGMFS